jgi:hypothetical protein
MGTISSKRFPSQFLVPARMLYLQEAINNLSIATFYELPLAKQHRTLEVLDRALIELPYLLSLPTLHQYLSALWRFSIVKDGADEILNYKIKESIVHTQIVMESLGMKVPLIATASPDPVTVETTLATTGLRY